MDVEYIYDTSSKQHQIDIIGEHSTIGRFLSTELDVHKEDATAIESFIDKLSCNNTHQVQFVEWTVEIDKDELKITHNSVLNHSFLKPDVEVGSEPEFEVGSADWQLSSECGRQDLILVLENWADFVKND